MKLIKLIKHKLKRKILKLYISYIKVLINPNMKNVYLSTNELKALNIATFALKNPNCNLSLCPITNKRYMKYNNYFIVITEQKIQIVNHVYAYDIAMSGKRFYNLKNNFDTKLYKKFKGIEEEILNNVKHSLDTILSNIRETNE